MSLSSDFDHEIAALADEYYKLQPNDVLQFCSNYFANRLASQRHENQQLAKQKQQPQHNYSPQQAAVPAMADSTFPGTNPFASSSERGMQRVMEEDEHEPLTSSQAPAFRQTELGGSPQQASTVTSNQGAPTFGSSGFMGGARLGPMEGSNLPNNYNFSRRTSVSAESMNPTATATENWTPPRYPKSAQQQERLRAAVMNNILFNHLDEEQTQLVLNALNEKPIPTGDIKVIEQGDAGNFFYVIEKGSFDVYVNPSGRIEPGPQGMGKKVASIGPGGSFGELALMYNAPRAATVVSTEGSTLWALDRMTFRRILMDSAFEKRRMYEAFLSEVPLLESLTPYERSKIADALRTRKLPAGETIIREGDAGDEFYILESGEAEVFIGGQAGAVKRYVKGDYFGELALLNDKPRAASVVSASEVKLAIIGKEGFQRLLGSLNELMRRNDPSRREEIRSGTAD